MKPVAVLVTALLLGAAAGELLCHWPAFRDLAGRTTGRGGLVRIVNGKGIYDADLGGDEERTIADAALAENLRRSAAGGKVDPSRVEEPFVVLQDQFADQKKFEQALRSAGLSDSALREKLEEQVRELDWLEKQIGTGNAVTEQECRTFYETHPEFFALPVRYRAAHIFLAAHSETPAEVVEEKEKAIGALAERLQQGEPLPQLAAEASEDEATKGRGGDLGYFSETRIPAEFVAELKKLKVGQVSAPFRSRLGFHIVQLTEIKPERVLSFEEARSEIAAVIANDRRASRVDRIAGEISAFASR